MINSPVRNSRWLWTIVTAAILLVTAADFRLTDLGELGFYGDEETSAFAAKSVAEGNGFKMPSGLPYYRAIPQTILNAISASLIGVDRELSYRLPAAIIGVLTPLVLVFLSRGLVPPFLAFAAGSLLVFSDWHIITSREARMYAPFMLCFLSTGLLYLRWAENLNFRRFVVIAVLAALTLLVHTLGLLIVLFPLTWLVLKSNKDSNLKCTLAIIAFVAAFYFLVNRLVIRQAFVEWPDAVSRALSATLSQPEPKGLFGPILELFPWNLSGMVGLIFGIWLGRCLVVSNADNRPWIATSSVVLLSACFALFLLSANFYAAGVTGVSLLLVQPIRTLEQLSRCKWPLIVLASSGLAVVLYVFSTTESVEGLKDHLRFPFPYFAYFWEYSPGLMVLYLAGVVSSTFPGRRDCEVNIRIFSLVAIGVITGMGIVSQWGGIRYLTGAYPFMLLVASYPLYQIHLYLFHRGKIVGYVGSAMLISVIFGGAVEGHSLQSAIAARDLNYGVSNRALILGLEIYPDHKSAGQYIMQHADERDIVIVEDALEQYWYTGRELVWLSDEVSNSKFMYVDSAGVLRDVYVNSKVLRSTETAAICNDHSETIWIVTSAENKYRRHLSLSEGQRNWLDNIRRNFSAVFLGRDETTSVFEISCSSLN